MHLNIERKHLMSSAILAYGLTLGYTDSRFNPPHGARWLQELALGGLDHSCRMT